MKGSFTMACYYKIRPDGSEELRYQQPDFPFRIDRDYLSTYPNYSYLSHWHDEIEMIRIRSGEMTYHVNGRDILLKKGEGIFVNARQLHYGSGDGECEFLCAVFHPMLLCSNSFIETQYVRPLLEDPGLAWMTFSEENADELPVIQKLDRLFDEGEGENDLLRQQAALFEIWDDLIRLGGIERKPDEPSQSRLTALRAMISHIQENYSGKISLEDISHAGSVGRTTCCALFREYTNLSPLAYLTDYRLERARELLQKTDLSVTAVGQEVGFSTPSYFAKMFRERYGKTPREFRYTLDSSSGKERMGESEN